MSKLDPLVQYIVVRTDLITKLGWTAGAVIAQACHATTAAALQYRKDEQARLYFEDVNNMHKIVLGISSETKLRNLAKRLTDFYVDHRVWTEQPEDIPTCLVTKPAPKSEKAEFFRKLQLFRITGEKSKMKDKENKSENDDSKSEARDKYGDRQVHVYGGAGNVPKIMDNDRGEHGSRKRNGSGRNQMKNDRDGHGREQRIGSAESYKKKHSDENTDHDQRNGSAESRASRKKKNNRDQVNQDQRSASGDSRVSRNKKDNGDNADHNRRSGSGDSRASHQKNNRDSDEVEEERTGSGESGKRRSKHESMKDRSYSREDRKESRREKERNDKSDVDDAFDRMSGSPKLPPIGPRPL